MPDLDFIYKEYFKDVYKYIRSLGVQQDVAEEITQETFFKALKNINQFDGKGNIRVWLCQIAKNTYFTYYAKEKRSKEYADEIEVAANAVSIEEYLINHETAFKLYQNLHHLNEPYKEVFYMRIFCELPFSQIAQIFKKSESWARVTFHRAKIKLQEVME